MVMVDDYTKIWRQWRKQTKFKLRLRRQRSAEFPTCVVPSPNTRDFILRLILVIVH